MKFNKATILNFYIPIFLFLIAFFWKFFYIGVRDICIDEPFTIFNAQKSIKEILLLPTQNEPNPPLFMFLLHFWIKLFGISPYSVRIIPLFFNATTAIFIYLAGKKIANYWGGIIASGLFILSSYQFYFGMETRTYSLLLCATAAAIYYLFSIIKEPSKRTLLIGLIFSNIILVYSHYFGWFVVFMEFVICLLYWKNKLALKKIFIALISTAFAFIPMASILIKQFLISKDNTWVRAPANTAYWKEIVMFLNDPIIINTALIVFAVGLVLFLFRRKNIKFPKEIVLLFIFWIVPYTTMFFVSSKIPMFENRYVMYNSIGLYLFIGTFISYLYDRWKLLTPMTGAVVLFFMFSNLHTEREFIAHREVKQAVSYIRQYSSNGYVTIIHPRWNDFEFAYYYDPEIFKDINNRETRLREKDIYNVWGLDDAIMNIKKNKGKNVAFFRGGSGFNDINNYLDSIYTRIDSAFFPDCYYIYVYDAQPDMNE